MFVEKTDKISAELAQKLNQLAGRYGAKQAHENVEYINAEEAYSYCLGQLDIAEKQIIDGLTDDEKQQVKKGVNHCAWDTLQLIVLGYQKEIQRMLGE